MKTFKYIACIFFSSVMFINCTDDFDAIPVNSALLPEDTKEWTATMTIGELIDKYDRIDNLYIYGDDTLHINPDGSTFTVNHDEYIYHNQKAWCLEYKDKIIKIQRETSVVYKNLFSNIPIESDEDIYIRGRVISSDTAGNIYKYMIIEDLETKQALKVSVDAGSLNGIFPLGQVVAIKCNGLSMGRYAQMPQLGVAGYRDNDKTRFEPGRIPYSLVPSHFIRIGTPDVSKVIADTLTIQELKDKDSTYYGRLVCIKNVKFTNKDDNGKELGARDPLVVLNEKNVDNKTYALNPIFAPSTYSTTKKYNIGYPVSREVSDATGLSYVSTSEYAEFAETLIPKSGDEGNVTAIVGWFKDKNVDNSGVSVKGKFQLTIRSLADLDGFKSLGQK